ncbi:MAG: methyltransferase [Pseudomonadota bacterium]
MRLDVVSENPLEWLAAAFGVVPSPVVQVSWGMAGASTIIAGVRLGIFDLLASGPLAAGEIAAQAGTHGLATEALCDALCGFGCLRRSRGRFSNTRSTAKWLVRDAKDSLVDAVLLLGILQEGFHGIEHTVRTGEVMDFHHGGHGPELWRPYLRGLAQLAKLPAGEIARRARVGAPKRLLDVGGGHGAFSCAFCRRYADLQAEVLDLPGAIPVGEELVASEGMAERVRYREGDLRRDAWGEGYDVVLLFNVIHNLSAEESRAAVGRAFEALAPGGRLVILEAEHRHVRDRIAQAGAFAEILCFLTSGTRAWSEEAMRGWMEEAGFSALRTWRPRFGPYMVVIEGGR